MENSEKFAALQDLISQGMGSVPKNYSFETMISKLAGKPKHEVSENVPVPTNIDDCELIAAALGTSVVKLVRRALDIEIRTVVVDSVKPDIEKAESEILKGLL